MMSNHTLANLHEVFFTRNYVTKNKVWMYLMNHPCNVVLRHDSMEGCIHGGGTGGDVILRACAQQIVHFEGWNRTEEYIVAVSEFYPQTGKDVLHRFYDLGLRR